MDPDHGHEDVHQRSARLTAASRALIRNARDHMQKTRERLDRARNVVQLSWLVRALHERRRHRGPDGDDGGP